MPRISSERVRGRESVLVSAAQSVFTSKGYSESAISEIAREAEVSDGLLYRYFGSKKDLLLAVLERFYARLIDNLERNVALETNFADRMSALIRGHVNVFVTDADLCRLFISEVRNFDDYFGSEAHAFNRRYTSILTSVIEDGMVAGQIAPTTDVRLVRDVLFGSIEHLAWRHILARQSIDVEEVTSAITRLLFFGLMGERGR